MAAYGQAIIIIIIVTYRFSFKNRVFPSVQVLILFRPILLVFIGKYYNIHCNVIYIITQGSQCFYYFLNYSLI